MDQFVLLLQNVLQSDAVLSVNAMTHAVYTPSEILGTFNAVAYQKCKHIINKYKKKSKNVNNTLNKEWEMTSECSKKREIERGEILFRNGNVNVNQSLVKRNYRMKVLKAYLLIHLENGSLRF